jgi:hypothetical protein
MKLKALGFSSIFTLNCVLGADDPNSVVVMPGANSRETYFTMHHIKEAQAITKGKGSKVGILDHSFGLALHPDLYAGGRNFVVDSDEFLSKREWHGYWMALVLHEIAPEAKIFALNTHSFKAPESEAEAISKAIDWAIQQKIDVLTYSHAAIDGEQRKILDTALDRAHAAGIVTTFIHTRHPGNIMPTGLFAGFGGDDGREPDLNVLHYDYTVIFLNEYKKQKSGEKSWWNPPFQSISSTSPVLGGVVALMRSLRPDITPSQCRRVLRETAHSMTFEGEKPPRVLDAFAAVKQVQQLH